MVSLPDPQSRDHRTPHCHPAPEPRLHVLRVAAPHPAHECGSCPLGPRPPSTAHGLRGARYGSSFPLTHEINCPSAILVGVFSIPSESASQRLPVWLKYTHKNVKTGLDVSYIDTCNSRDGVTGGPTHPTPPFRTEVTHFPINTQPREWLLLRTHMLSGTGDTGVVVPRSLRHLSHLPTKGPAPQGERAEAEGAQAPCAGRTGPCSTSSTTRPLPAPLHWDAGEGGVAEGLPAGGGRGCPRRWEPPAALTTGPSPWPCRATNPTQEARPKGPWPGHCQDWTPQERMPELAQATPHQELQ